MKKEQKHYLKEHLQNALEYFSPEQSIFILNRDHYIFFNALK